MTTFSRGRLPSFDVQRETRAALAAAMSDKRLPASISDIGGIIVTEKNTFITITQASEYDVEIDRDLNDPEVSPINPIPSTRKKTEGVIVPSREQGCSTSSIVRRSSCPPRVTEQESPSSNDCNRTVSSRPNVCVSPVKTTTPMPNKNRRHYSIDFSHQTISSPFTTSPSSPLKPVDETSASTIPCTPTEINIPKTTVMLRNVPYSESQLGVLNLIEERGFSGRFDFFYAPLDFSSGNNLGYAFLNFNDEKAVSEFYTVFDGLRVDKEGWAQKDLQVCWARVQGLRPNVEHYRNSPVNDMPENFRPMVFDANGHQLPFPRPDENLVRRNMPNVYSSGSRGVMTRPRFASAHFPSGAATTASRRRNSGMTTGGGFTRM